MISSINKERAPQRWRGKVIMWLFEAKYVNMDNGKGVTRKIAFDEENLCDTEHQCYIMLKNRKEILK